MVAFPHPYFLTRETTLFIFTFLRKKKNTYSPLRVALNLLDTNPVRALLTQTYLNQTYKINIKIYFNPQNCLWFGLIKRETVVSSSSDLLIDCLL